MRLLWVLSLAGAALGGLQLVSVFTEAKSAPQQASGAAIALALAVLPYCLARSIQGLTGGMDSDGALDRAAADSGRARRCPHCRGVISQKASACRHCGRDVQPAPEQQDAIG